MHDTIFFIPWGLLIFVVGGTLALVLGALILWVLRLTSASPGDGDRQR